MSVKQYYEDRQKYEEALDALKALESNDEDILEAIFVLEMLLSEPKPSVEEIISESAYKDGGGIKKRKRYEYNDLTVPKQSDLIEIMDMPNTPEEPLYRYGRGFKNGGGVGDYEVKVDFYSSDNIDEYYDTLVDEEYKKFDIIRKYVDFDKVEGLYNFSDEVDLKFLKDGEEVLKIQGYWKNEYEGSYLLVQMEVNDNSVEIDYHPFGFGGIDEEKFERDFKLAYDEINEYTAVISYQGEAIYTENVAGIKNAENMVQDLKDNTEIYLVKGYLPKGKLVPDEAKKYVKGGRVRFKDKVEAIANRLEGTKVPKRLEKDYGKRYNREEAIQAGRRIAGSMMKKGY